MLTSIKHRFSLLCISILLTQITRAVPDTLYPEVGQPCPYFLLNNIQHYPVGQKSLKDFKGKPFILDFFAIGCPTCFESLPAINTLKRDYGPALDVILVGREDKGIHEFVEQFMNSKKLNLPVAYSKSLFNQFGIQNVPFVLWVDGKGIVKAITDSKTLTKGNLDLFLKNMDFSFVDQSHKADLYKDLQYDWEKPLLINNNGGNDTSYLFRSVLSRWNPTLPQVIPPMVSNSQFNRYGYIKPNRFQATGIWLSLLYQMAYGDTLWPYPSLNLPNSYGHIANKPELLIKDSTAFNFDFHTGEGIYCYSLIVPPRRFTTRDLQRMIQNDLTNYFQYKVTAEEKAMPCWILEADSSARMKLQSRGGPMRTGEGDRYNIHLNNVPITALIAHLFFNHLDAPPFIDETGITGNIDLQLNGFIDDSLDKIAIDLKSHGLFLHPGKRMMKVVVIRDGNKEE